MDGYVMEINKRVVAQICLTIGWHAIKPSALTVLTDILHRYLQKLAVSILSRSEHCSRAVPVLEDLESVFQELNISWSGLQEYVENVPPVPCPVRVPKFPIQCKSHLNFLKPGSQEVITRPIFIHEYLPTMHLQMKEKDSLRKTHGSLDAGCKSQIETPPNSSAECSVFKRPRHTTVLENSCMKKNRRPPLNEGSSPLRELSSVMMTSSGFLSPAREGKLPNSHFNTKSGPSYPAVPPDLIDKHSFMMSDFNTNEDKETVNKIYFDEAHSFTVGDLSQETSIVNEKYVKPKKQKLSIVIKTNEFNESNVYAVEQDNILESVEKEESLCKIGETIEAVIHQHQLKSVDKDLTIQQEQIKKNEYFTDCNSLRRRLQYLPLGISVIPNNPDISFNREKKFDKSKRSTNQGEKESPMQFNINSQEQYILEKPHLDMNQELKHPMFESQYSRFHRTHSALASASLQPTCLVHCRFPKNQPPISGKSISCASASKSSMSTLTSSQKQLFLCSEQNLQQDSFEDKNIDYHKKWKAMKKYEDKSSDNTIQIMINNTIEKRKGNCKIKIKDKYKSKKKKNKSAKNDKKEPHFDGDELQFRSQNEKKITNRIVLNQVDLKNCSGFVKHVKICNSMKQEYQNSNFTTKVEMKDFTKEFKRETEPVHEASYIDNDGMEVWICPACAERDNGSPMIGCDGCDAWYHWTCVGIQDPPDSSDWFCRVCSDKKK